ncbi:hypothetical protein ABZ250_38595 [Streptomyces afghaniensis]|uniref:hypothetical protein n=1 Tax=Streptomyces afghaniensis TaxID=66865 RepID=UPI0033AA4B71
MSGVRYTIDTYGRPPGAAATTRRFSAAIRSSTGATARLDERRSTSGDASAASRPTHLRIRPSPMAVRARQDRRGARP